MDNRSEEVLKEVLAVLDSHELDYELVEHEPATTSAEAEQVTGLAKSCSAKTIVFKVGDSFVMAIVRGDNRVDFKKLKDHFKARKARLATPQEVYEVMRVEIGSCYPFPDVAGLVGVVDHSLAEVDRIGFSPGTNRHHILIKWDDYRRAFNPNLIDLVKLT